MSESKIYKIKSGETISSVAEGDPLYIKIIMEANPNLKPEKLRVGQEIILPPRPNRPNLHLNPSQNVITFIKGYEGDSKGHPFLTSYDDGFGNITIGWGHNLGKNTSQKTISLADAENLLKKDIEVAASYIRRNIMAPLNQAKFDALVSLVFNAGAKAFTRTELHDLIQEGKFISALRVFPQTLIGENQRGLIDRRLRETAMFSGVA